MLDETNYCRLVLYTIQENFSNKQNGLKIKHLKIKHLSHFVLHGAGPVCIAVAHPIATPLIGYCTPTCYKRVVIVHVNVMLSSYGISYQQYFKYSLQTIKSSAHNI